MSMNQIVIHDQELPAPDGMQVLNFKSGGQYRFVNQKRVCDVTEVIIHETVTSSAQATLDVLQQRNLGVHFIVGSDGTVHQHGDLKDDFLWHASEHNPQSIGIETVNPYYPHLAPANSVWSKVIDAPWADQGRYLVPTPTQAETVCQLISWFTTASGLAIPKTWRGLSEKKMCMVRTPVSELGPGIYAHHYFGHADGAWLVLYAWLRLEPGLDPETAYDAACSLATGATAAVDLGEYYAANPLLIA
jgi:hypothetical protein